MNKFLSLTFVYGISIALGVLVMINGYGVEVKSWPWIIMGGAFGRLIVEIFATMSKSSE